MRAKAPTVRVPLKITFQIKKGKAEKVSAEYADIPADTIARYLIQGLGIPFQDKEHIEAVTE